MIVWLNGEFLASGAWIDVADRGFLIGDGAFETIYVDRGRTAFLSRHLERLALGLKALDFPVALDAAEFDAIAAELATANAVAGPAALRLTVTRGPAGGGLARPAGDDVRPTSLAVLTARTAPPAEMKLRLAGQRRYSKAAAAGFKAIGGYTDNMAALAEARAAGADEALMLNEHGRLASAAAANVYVIGPDGVVATPPQNEGAMAGVVRGLLLAGGHGVRIEERPVAADAVGRDFLFVTNSLRGLVAGAGQVGGKGRAAFEKLRTWYQEALAQEISRERRPQ